MKRTLYQSLIEWQQSPDRKPLLLQGARQVGKTYLMMHFAKQAYEHYVYFNFEEDPSLATLFESQLNPETLIEQLAFYIGKKIEPHNTLIIFDEIQLAPRAITSLKYFCEKTRHYHVMAAGSLLGVSIGQQISFPVGKVDSLHLYPLTFIEYLEAMNENMLAQLLKEKNDFKPLAEPIHNKLNTHFKTFLFIGGMPEVVNHYRKHLDIAAVKNIRKNIHQSYTNDFSKYAAPHESLKISAIWQNIPSQLAKDSKKFRFNQIEKNARYSSYELAIEWLRKAGLIHPTYNITTAKLPLAGYKEPNKFKLYYLDTGLLSSNLNMDPQLITQPHTLYTEFKGAIIENYVAKEMKSFMDEDLYYWTSNSAAEVDFVIAQKNKIYPIEVKSGMSQHKKSLLSFQQKYHSELILRFSPRNFSKAGSFINVPLYAVCFLYQLLDTEALFGT